MPRLGRVGYRHHVFRHGLLQLRRAGGNHLFWRRTSSSLTSNFAAASALVGEICGFSLVFQSSQIATIGVSGCPPWPWRTAPPRSCAPLPPGAGGAGSRGTHNRHCGAAAGLIPQNASLIPAEDAPVNPAATHPVNLDFLRAVAAEVRRYRGPPRRSPCSWVSRSGCISICSPRPTAPTRPLPRGWRRRSGRPSRRRPNGCASGT